MACMWVITPTLALVWAFRHPDRKRRKALRKSVRQTYAKHGAVHIRAFVAGNVLATAVLAPKCVEGEVLQ